MILLTQSRGALIGLVFALVLFFLMHSSGKRVRTLLSALALGVLVLPLVPDSAWERFSGLKFLTSTETVAEADPEGSAEARYHIWRVARTLISEHPATGVGLGAYNTAHSQYAPRLNVPPAALGNKDTHSTYLNVAAETGLFGALIFLAMIAVVMVDADVTRRRARRTYRAQQLLALELGLLAFMLAGIFGSFAKLSSLYVQLTFIWVTARLTKHELATGALQQGVTVVPAPAPTHTPAVRARRAG
jgi:O-antigen ligase